MAFHARNPRSPQSARESSKESVFGLAGWLFADLLLALSVVFLVAQDRQKVESKEETVEISESEYDELLKSAQAGEELKDICDLNGCAKARGLSPGEQLVVIVPGGARRGLTVPGMKSALNRASLSLEKKDQSKETTWDQLKKENRRIGFVIFFTKRGKGSDGAKVNAQDNLPELVQALDSKGLINEDLQLEKGSDGEFRFDVFPSLVGKYDALDVKGDDLMIRAFLFTYTSPKSN